MRILLFAAAGGLVLTSAAHAEPATEVGAVIVTATRLPAVAQNIPGARVIGEDQIDARQATFAADVLNTTPGLSVFRTGAAGGTTSVRMRGAETDKTLVLIDGVPANDPSIPDGGYDFSALDLADVARIEILSGPQGSIWGSDAIGGVIAFTTRELNGLRTRVEAGSRNTIRAAAQLGMAREDHAVGLSVAGYRTDGLSAAANGTEADGFTTWTASANARKQFGPVEVDGRIRYVDAEVDQDGYDADTFAFGDTFDTYESQAWSGFLRASGEAFGLRQTVSFSGYDITRASHSAFPSAFDADRQVWRWTAERGAAADPLAFIVGAEREDTSAVLSAGEAEQGATSMFGVARWRPVEALTATASLRYDDPDEYEGETTARVSAAYELGWGLTASAAWGQGFKTPTISHTVCDFCFPAGPSTDLTPERAEGWDVRLGWGSEDGRYGADLTGYRLRVRDQIAYAGRYVNLERTLTKGIEASAQAQLMDGVNLRAAYAWTDAIDATTGLELYRAPEHTGSVSLDWAWGPASGALTVRAESEQADIDPTTFSRSQRDGFVTADAAMAWMLGDGVEFTARIENLADEDYQEVLGYGEAGRSVFAGFRFRN